jgi:hypothetical protein
MEESYGREEYKDSQKECINTIFYKIYLERRRSSFDDKNSCCYRWLRKR